MMRRCFRSRRSPLGNLAFCVTGVILSYVVYHLLFERLVTSATTSTSEIGLIFFANGFNSLLVFGLLKAQSQAVISLGRSRSSGQVKTIPTWHALRIAGCVLGAAWCTQRALRYIDVPTQTIAKSCKPLPTMFLGVILGRRYNALQYVSTFVICAGVLMFNYASGPMMMSRLPKKGVESSSEHHGHEFHMIGLGLIVLALVFDGACGVLEDKLVTEMKWQHHSNHVGTLQLMFAINFYSMPMSFLLLLLSENASDFATFVFQYGFNIIGVTSVGSLGQLFIFHTINTNGALTCSIITTCRKMFTVILSVMIFDHVLNPCQWLGIFCTFIGLAMDIHYKVLHNAPGKGKIKDVKYESDKTSLIA